MHGLFAVWMFLGTAQVKDSAKAGYLAGETHPVVVFVRHFFVGTPRGDEAQKFLESQGWANIQFEKMAKVDRRNVGTEPNSREAFDYAMKHGSSMIVYAGLTAAER